MSGQVIAFVTQKGGSGKSCCAVNYAAWQWKRKKRAILIDADVQQSALTWVRSIDESLPVVSINNADDLIEKTPEFTEQFDRVVIDGPGQVSEENRGILLVCDLAVVPCQPSGLDLHSADAIFRLIRQARQVRGGVPKAVTFLSRAVIRSKLERETEAILKDIPGVKYLPYSIHQRQVISDCFGQEASIWSISDREAKKAAAEYEALFKAIEKELKS